MNTQNRSSVASVPQNPCVLPIEAEMCDLSAEIETVMSVFKYQWYD